MLQKKTVNFNTLKDLTRRFIVILQQNAVNRTVFRSKYNNSMKFCQKLLTDIPGMNISTF